jgi:riboflavin transporter 2
MVPKAWRRDEYITYALLTFVFLSSWTDINGIFSELPQIVLTQPEKWKLGAYIGLITNMGNIAPLALILLRCAYRKSVISLIPINYVLIFIGMLSCLLLVFFWSKTTFILNQDRSVSLFVLAFFLSLLDCTSMVTFSDYLTRFRTKFTSALFLGESLTTILPSLLAIAQGNGQAQCIPSEQNITSSNISITVVYKTARFSVSIYFLCIFFLLTTSLMAFLLLQWTNIAQTSYHSGSDEAPVLKGSVNKIHDANTDVQKQPYKLTSLHYLLLSLGCIYTSSVLFGMLLSISAYVLMPYGHQIFYLGTILSPWMLSLVWVLGMLKPFVAKRYLLIMIMLGSVTFAFKMYFSFKSPCPPYVHTTEGNIVVLFIWLSTYVLLGYPRLVIANYVRLYSANGMFWFGAHVQLGALIGSVVAYLMVDTFSLFQEQLPCEQASC